VQLASPLRSAADLPLARRPARELARLIRTRAVSPVEVLDAAACVARARRARYGDELARLLFKGLRRIVVNSGVGITIRPKGERRYVSPSMRPPALPPRRFCR
jgi:hypothetical protein